MLQRFDILSREPYPIISRRVNVVEGPYTHPGSNNPLDFGYYEDSLLAFCDVVFPTDIKDYMPYRRRDVPLLFEGELAGLYKMKTEDPNIIAISYIDPKKFGYPINRIENEHFRETLRIPRTMLILEQNPDSGYRCSLPVDKVFIQFPMSTLPRPDFGGWSPLAPIFDYIEPKIAAVIRDVESRESYDPERSPRTGSKRSAAVELAQRL